MVDFTQSKPEAPGEAKPFAHPGTLRGARPAVPAARGGSLGGMGPLRAPGLAAIGTGGGRQVWRSSFS